MVKVFSTLFVALSATPLILSGSTLAFQQGAEVFLDGSGTGITYTSGEDAELRAENPNTNFNIGAESGTNTIPGLGTNYASSSVDSDKNGFEVQTILKFGDIFGAGVGQIPLGSVITSATLSLYEINEGAGLEFRGLLADWDQSTVTWNNYGSGSGGASDPADVTSDFLLAPAGDTIGNKAPEVRQFDVTQFVTAWSSGALENYGIVIKTDLNSTGGLAPGNGVDFLISENPDVSFRPMLVVEFTEVPEPAYAGALTGLLVFLVALRRRSA